MKKFLFAHWRKIMISFVIGMIFTLIYFNDLNKFSIKTLPLEDGVVKTSMIDGTERDIVTAHQIRTFFSENLGFYDENLFDTYDGEYVLLYENEIKDFYPTYYEFEKKMGLVYVPNRNDCDDIAKTFSRYFTIVWNKDRIDRLSPAIGYVAYITRNNTSHMIIVAFTKKDNKLHPLFYDVRPEFQEIKLTEDEFFGIFGGEMN